jgi:3-hydroxybutyryl-CoA dehydrogenase
MGRSIATCLLAAGHEVVAADTSADARAGAPAAVAAGLAALATEGLLQADPTACAARFAVAASPAAMAHCGIVIEAAVEDEDAKRAIIAELESVLARTAVIGSNTSAIPVTDLQRDAEVPARVVGIHWAEPAHITRFMEIICGAATSSAVADQVCQLAEAWGKEPSVLRRDIRGFITNRIFYAMLREACHLVDNGYCSVEDVDRSLRNDLGYWLTLAGPFRWMDLTGIPAYATVMESLAPELCNAPGVPAILQDAADRGARGVANADGFYDYTEETAAAWAERLVDFTCDIRQLALKYNAQAAADAAADGASETC